ncbi:FAD-dependent monooxygenase [Nodosilinea sp. FACHB-131]|uniref:FAD-dependent monooxygenase n=1 Tax=Cyanophyceae TaxID=3028117 RepID=UPI00168895A1|nr:FAD-dependent monooxygenase [Nodosilinea sp. FACHB-131]MBD1873798.1 FAD-dependent monooxygenase [Nodosilinea sp. FACHB-131]
MVDTSSQNILIVGARPAGLLLAHYLLRRGCRVQICDRRPEPRQIAPDQQRSFPISLQYRGRCTHFSSSAARRSNVSQMLPQFSQ